MPRKKSITKTHIPHGGQWQAFNLMNDDFTPDNMASVLRSARMGEIGRLYRVYERMETDDRFGGVVSSLKRAISRRRLRITASRNYNTAQEKEIAREYAERTRTLLSELTFRKVSKVLVRPYIFGMGGYEIDYVRKDVAGLGRRPVPTKLAPVPTARMAYDTSDDENRWGKMGIRMADGKIKLFEEFRNDKVSMMEDEPQRGKWADAGVARRCLSWLMVKRFAQQWWAEYGELYGEPFRIARTDSYDIDDDMRDFLGQMLESLGKNGWGIIPEDVAFELMEANRSGSVQTYSDLIKYANDAYAVAVLGQIQTTDGGRNGSFAKAQIQNNVRHDILQDVAKMVEDGYEHIAESTLSLSYGGKFLPHLTPNFNVVVANPTELQSKASAYNKIQEDMGVPISERQVRDEFALDTPDENEAIVANGKRYESMQDYLDDMERQAEAQEAALQEDAEGPQDAEIDRDEANEEETGDSTPSNDNDSQA